MIVSFTSLLPSKPETSIDPRRSEAFSLLFWIFLATQILYFSEIVKVISRKIVEFQ